MTEEIIIDGVNVAGCVCYATSQGVATASGVIIKDIDNACIPKQRSCTEIKDCMFKKQYKQLQRLEQENRILKIEKISFNKYKQALEEIRDYADGLYNEPLIEGSKIRLKSGMHRIKSIINEVLNDK